MGFAADQIEMRNSTQTRRERRIDGKNEYRKEFIGESGGEELKGKQSFGIGTAFGLRNGEEKNEHIPADSLSVTVIYIFQQCNLCVEFLN